jgi:hypothetical protein
MAIYWPQRLNQSELSIMESLFYGFPIVGFDCHYDPASMKLD